MESDYFNFKKYYSVIMLAARNSDLLFTYVIIGALKNRFRLWHKRIEFKLSNTTNIIKTAAILHNLCVMNNDDEEID